MSTISQNLYDSANGGGSGQSIISRDQFLTATSQIGNSEDDLIVLTPYPVEPGHTLLSILRLASCQWRPEMKANAAHVAGGDKAGIIINKPASIMDYNKAQAAQNERIQPPSAKLSFKVLMTNSETKISSLEHRTLRFWLNNEQLNSNNNNNNNTIENKNNYDYDDEQREQKARHAYASSKQQSSQLAQSYFCNLLGTKPDDDFPKSYIDFIIKLMRILKQNQFKLVCRMEVEIRKLSCEDNANKSTTRSGSLETQILPPIGASRVTIGQSVGQTGRKSPLTSQKVLDIIESSYPNPISVKEICSSTQSNEQQVRLLLEELSTKEKIAPTGKDQGHYTRTTKATSDTKIQLVKQMPIVIRAKQPVIAIITSQYYEKLAVDAMISDKETFVRYRTTHGDGSVGNSDVNSSANYVYTLGNIGDHRVVSTKLTSVGHSRGALIAAGNATTRLLGTFPEIEYVFLVGCAGGVPNYTDFASHVRLGDVVISHIPSSLSNDILSSPQSCSSKKHQGISKSSKSGSPDEYVYVHCRAKSQANASGPNGNQKNDGQQSSIPPSFSIHTNLKRLNSLTSNGARDQDNQLSSSSSTSSLSPSSSNQIKDARWFERQNKIFQQQQSGEDDTKAATVQVNQEKPVEYDQCHFRLWRPAKLDLQELSNFLWAQGLKEQKHRIWEYYIEHGTKMLAQLDIDANRPKDDQDKLYMSLGDSGTIEVSHPEAGDDEVDLRREGHPMCHFGPIGSGMPPTENEQLRQRMITEFGLRCFDMEFDPVVESIYGNCKESYVMIRGISDYQDGRKRKEWQQYAALVAAAFMKSIIVNLKPI